ncbi:MATE family efflux transporter [uncultured Alistipes sp.]|uniref:MATE family efflux transporter n=1 Tax=uncultured Alistipes sp. TaxID=538949 RepID=UPI00260B1E2A|nr:MATE family efflux transporter [uncultured Alistipes sp.]
MQPTYRQIWAIASPILVSLLMENLIGITDTAFLGRVGEVELGASALGGVLYLAVFMLGFGFSIGAQILIARRNGERAYAEIGPLFRQGFAFLLALAAAMFVLSRVLAPVVLGSIVESEPVRQAAVRYTNWRVFGFFFSFTAFMFRAFYVGTTNTRTLTLNSVAMVLTNVALNYVLIFGKLGLPAMGIAGAAIASSASEFVSLAFFYIYTRTKTDHRRYGLFRRGKFDIGMLRRMLDVSVWTMLQLFLSVAIWFLFFVAVEHLGERPLAVTNIVRSVSGIVFMVVSAFGSTASTLTGNLLGAGEARLVGPTAARIVRMCYLLVAPVALLFALFPEWILRVYTDDPSLIGASTASLRVMLSSYVFTVPALVLFNVVSGAGNTRSALFLEFAALCVYSVYMVGIVIVHRADVAVCWTTEHVYAIALLVFVSIYLARANWKNKAI